MRNVSSRVAAKPLPQNKSQQSGSPYVPHAGGRPTLYRKEYCDLVIEEMGRGYSIGAVAGLLRVSRTTITSWMKEHAEFLAAVNIGKSLRLRQWETIALGVASGQINGNSGMTTLGLKNSGAEDWVDRQEVKLIDQCDEEDALEFIEGRLAELGVRNREEEHSRRPN